MVSARAAPICTIVGLQTNYLDSSYTIAVQLVYGEERSGTFGSDGYLLLFLKTMQEMNGFS